MSGKRNVSICIGHELANALYFKENSVINSAKVTKVKLAVPRNSATTI